MTNIEPNDIDEKPLDPEVEKVRKKMVRLLAVSIGVMMIGVMAVLFAIVYKFTRSTTNSPASQSTLNAGVPVDAPLIDHINLPAGFQVISVSLDAGKVAFFGTGSDEQSRILLFDATTGKRLGTIEIGQNR